MGSISKLALCTAALILIAAVPSETGRLNPVYINGNRFAVGLTINRTIYISVDDLAKALGGSNLQQAGLALQGTKLWAVAPNTRAVVSPRDPASGLPTGKRMHKPFVVTRNAVITPGVVGYNGKLYVSLADVAGAFGGTLNINQASLPENQPIMLNFAPNSNAALSMNP